MSITVTANGLPPAGVISNIVLAFNNPTRVSFTFSLTPASLEGLLLPGDPSATALHRLEKAFKKITRRPIVRLSPGGTMTDEIKSLSVNNH